MSETVADIAKYQEKDIKKIESWDDQISKIQPFTKQETFNQWKRESPKSFEKLFPKWEGKRVAIVCMDERCSCARFQKEDPKFITFNGAGSLLLFGSTPEEIVDNFWPIFLRLIERGATLDIITGHKGCGAAALVNLDNPDKIANPDNIAYQKLEKVVELLNARIVAESIKHHAEIKFEKITELEGDDDYHHAVSCFVNLQPDNSISVGSSKDFPDAFALNARKIRNFEQTRNEIMVAIAIATGGHGYGIASEDNASNFGFSSKNPFRVVVVRDKKSETQREYKYHSEQLQNPFQENLFDGPSPFTGGTSEVEKDLNNKWKHAKELIKKGIVTFVELDTSSAEE